MLFLWIVPDNQLNCRWLSPSDRILAIERIRVNGQGVGNKHFKWYQLREALTDPLAWAFFMYALVADIPNGGLSNFFSQLIVGFGYTPEQSLLYGAPGGVVEIVALIVCGWAGDRFGYRILISMSGMVLALLGMILIVALPLENNSGRLAGYYLTQASPTPFVAILSLISSNVAGYTKKTTVAAFFLIGYCTGNIIGMAISLSFFLLLFFFFPPCLVPLADRRAPRPANLPPLPGPALRPRRNHNLRLLRAVPGHHGLHPLLLRAPERQEGRDPQRTGLRALGEPGVVGPDGSGESGIRVHAVRGGGRGEVRMRGGRQDMGGGCVCRSVVGDLAGMVW